MNILEPFKRLTIFEPVEKDGETTEKKVTVGIIYRSDGLYAWDNSRAIPNEYDEAIKWSPASQLPEYAIRRKAIVTKFEYKPLRSFTADDIKLLRLDYASQDDPQLLMEEYLPIKNFELLFEIPEHLVGKLQPGFRVACNTARGRRYGTVVAADLDEQDVKEVMLASGATFPLSTIEATTQKVPMGIIKIPGYIARTKPSDEKIAKRFLEFYHTGQFNTNVALDDNAVLIDGYSAYLVAQKVGLAFLPAIYKEV